MQIPRNKRGIYLGKLEKSYGLLNEKCINKTYEDDKQDIMKRRGLGEKDQETNVEKVNMKKSPWKEDGSRSRKEEKPCLNMMNPKEGIDLLFFTLFSFSNIYEEGWKMDVVKWLQVARISYQKARAHAPHSNSMCCSMYHLRHHSYSPPSYVNPHRYKVFHTPHRSRTKA